MAAQLKEIDIVARSSFSPLQDIRRSQPIPLPAILSHGNLKLAMKEALGAVADHEEIQKLFPATYGRSRKISLMYYFLLTCCRSCA
jgi:hypothetical protein